MKKSVAIDIEPPHISANNAERVSGLAVVIEDAESGDVVHQCEIPLDGRFRGEKQRVHFKATDGKSIRVRARCTGDGSDVIDSTDLVTSLTVGDQAVGKLKIERGPGTRYPLPEPSTIELVGVEDSSEPEMVGATADVSGAELSVDGESVGVVTEGTVEVSPKPERSSRRRS